METEKDLNAKIAKVTLQINSNYPWLSKSLDDIPVSVRDESMPAINLKNLTHYYNSINSILIEDDLNVLQSFSH